MRHIITVSFEDGEKTGEYIYNKPIELETNVSRKKATLKKI